MLWRPSVPLALPASAEGLCFGDERLEQSLVVGLHLGVPEHAERERLRGILDRLERPVLGKRALDEPLPHPADTLMMARVDGAVAGTEDLLEPRPLRDLDRVLGEDAQRLTMTLVPDLLREMLDEVTAPQHVQQLKAAADRERREIASECRLEEAELARVAAYLCRVRRRVALRTVLPRIDVDPAEKMMPSRMSSVSSTPSSLGGTSSARPPACSTDST